MKHPTKKHIEDQLVAASRYWQKNRTQILLLMLTWLTLFGAMYVVMGR